MNFITKTTALGIFDFRPYLNIAMLIAESERARLMRQAILDLVASYEYGFAKVLEEAFGKKAHFDQ